MDAEKRLEKISEEIKEFFSRCGKGKAVIGLSGGIDSALSAFLVVKALGKENLEAIIMPEEGLSSKEGIEDAKKLAGFLGIGYILQPVNAFVEKFEAVEWKLTDIAKGNLRARARMVLLYSYANSKNALVVGTGNRSELLLGYFTKYGDGGADFLPIGGLYKGDVMELARAAGIPEEILAKKPSAELWKGQSDEKDIGMKYGKIDAILKLLVDEGNSIKDAAEIYGNKAAVEAIAKRIDTNRHKGQLPFVIPAG
ncbi:MAG: NAD+ synthase [Candidatus Diapherotrites archaeon]